MLYKISGLSGQARQWQTLTVYCSGIATSSAWGGLGATTPRNGREIDTHEQARGSSHLKLRLSWILLRLILDVLQYPLPFHPNGGDKVSWRPNYILSRIPIFHPPKLFPQFATSHPFHFPHYLTNWIFRGNNHHHVDMICLDTIFDYLAPR